MVTCPASSETAFWFKHPKQAEGYLLDHNECHRDWAARLVRNSAVRITVRNVGSARAKCRLRNLPDCTPHITGVVQKEAGSLCICWWRLFWFSAWLILIEHTGEFLSEHKLCHTASSTNPEKDTTVAGCCCFHSCSCAWGYFRVAFGLIGHTGTATVTASPERS